MKPIQFLQRLQPSNSTSIFNAIAKERRQNLYLLSRQVLWRKRLDHGREIGNGFAPQNGILVIDVLAQGLHDFDEGCFPGFDILTHNYR